MSSREQEQWDAFWAMVGLARESTAKFDAKLREMDQAALISLYKMYGQRVADLKDYEYVQHLEGMSEGAIDDIAYRIVEQGEDYYLDVVEHPERIRRPVEIADLGFDGRGAIVEVYESRFGEPIWKHLREGRTST
jgi:hypothetical protein